MEIKGKVIQSLPLEGGTSKSGNTWQKAGLIIDTTENPKYPRKVKVSNMKNADAFSKIPIGTDVSLKVEIESREYNGRWYTEVNCWGWDMAGSAQPAPPQQPQSATPVLDSMGVRGYQSPQQAMQPQTVAGADNLPF